MRNFRMPNGRFATAAERKFIQKIRRKIAMLWIALIIVVMLLAAAIAYILNPIQLW